MRRPANHHLFALMLAVISLTFGIGAFGLVHFLPMGVLKTTWETALYFLLTSAILAFSYMLFIHSSRRQTAESAQPRP